MECGSLFGKFNFIGHDECGEWGDCNIHYYIYMGSNCDIPHRIREKVFEVLDM